MMTRRHVLAAALALAMPVMAQTVAGELKTDQPETEKWWRIETSGIGG